LDGDSVEDEPEDCDEDELKYSDDIAPIAGPKALTSVTLPSQPGTFGNAPQFIGYYTKPAPTNSMEIPQNF
jgi:hypothetical protein